VPASRPAGVGLLVDRHQPHEAHQPTYPLLVHQMALVAQVPGHLADTEERGLQELLVDLTHQAEVLIGLAFGCVVEGRARNRQQLALLPDGQLGVIRLDHAAKDFAGDIAFEVAKCLQFTTLPPLFISYTFP